MGDEDAGRSEARERRTREHEARGRERGASERERDGDGLGFTLPPISLPEMRLPERIRLVFPVPDPPEKVSRPTRVRVSWVVLAVVLADALDAFAVLWIGPDALAWGRATVGVLLAVVLVGGPGVLYAWELLAILGGVGWLSVAPTLAALFLARLVRSQ